MFYFHMKLELEMNFPIHTELEKKNQLLMKNSSQRKLGLVLNQDQ